MAYFTFTFNNTNDDQNFWFDDLIDTAGNPRQIGVVNYDTTSGPQQCWVGEDGNGRIQLNGEQSGPLNMVIDEDNYNFDYT